MTTQPMANAKTEDFRNAHAALIRAAQVAQSLAKQVNTLPLGQQNLQVKKTNNLG